MGKYKVIIKETADKDLAAHKRSGQKSSNKKIIKILGELNKHPYIGTGNPKPLKYKLASISREELIKKTEWYIV